MGYNIGSNNPRWKGGKPKCIVCKKELTHRKKNSICRDCRKLIKREKETCKCGNHKSNVSEVCMKCDSIRKSEEYKGINISRRNISVPD